MENKEKYQYTFDKVVTHMLTQKQKAVVNDIERDVCAYRTPSGLKCAVGCLIPDSIDIPKSYNSVTVRELLDLDQIYNLFEKEYVTDLDFLRQLQTIHDVRPPERWDIFLKEFADAWDLEFNPPS